MSYTDDVSITAPPKTLLHGLSKTRSGSPSISAHSLIERARESGFADRLKKAVSEDEALDAAKTLSQSRKSRVRRYAEGATIGAAASPVLKAVGRGVEATVGAPKGMGSWRAGLARAAVKNIGRGELAKQVTEGALAGGGVQAIREGIEVGRAKKTVKTFIGERTEKMSMGVNEYFKKTKRGKDFAKQEREALADMDGTED